MRKLLLMLLILATPFTIAQSRPQKHPAEFSTIYTVKKGDTKYWLDRQFCVSTFPSNIEPGQKYEVEYNIEEIMSIYLKYAEKYKVDNTEMMHVLMANTINKGLPPCLVLALATQESSLKDKAYSSTNDYGILQVNKIHLKKYSITKSQIKSFRRNIPIGLDILNEKDAKYNRSDWWVAYNTGSKFSLLKCLDEECNKSIDVAAKYRIKVNRIMEDIRATQTTLKRRG